MTSPKTSLTKINEPSYLSGFGNENATEALPGTLPIGRNSPQQAPHGLYAEQLSGTAFTAPRATNRRSWLYRIHPSAMHPPFRPHAQGFLRGTPFSEVETSPDRLRWDPLLLPTQATDFLDGLYTIAGNGDLWSQTGSAAHVYLANTNMQRVFYDADGELLFVPQLGRLRLVTELGILMVAPSEIAVIPRGIKFRVELPDGPSRGYVAENYGAPLRLPELGPIGANGLANARDFLSPVAAFEESSKATTLVAKFGGKLWVTELAHSPLDVVAWHGNYAPYKYDLRHFNAINSVSFDHPDPSIFTVLTSLSETPGTANLDFVVFPPRWMVAENTFRPPWFHRNVMSELMGLIHGRYDAKTEGFLPGGLSLHNCMSAHGPDQASYAKAVSANLAPQYLADTLAFMFETRFVWRPTAFALNTPQLQHDYDNCWAHFPNTFKP